MSLQSRSSRPVAALDPGRERGGKGRTFAGSVHSGPAGPLHRRGGRSQPSRIRATCRLAAETLSHQADDLLVFVFSPADDMGEGDEEAEPQAGQREQVDVGSGHVRGCGVAEGAHGLARARVGRGGGFQVDEDDRIVGADQDVAGMQVTEGDTPVVHAADSLFHLVHDVQRPPGVVGVPCRVRVAYEQGLRCATTWLSGIPGTYSRARKRCSCPRR